MIVSPREELSAFFVCILVGLSVGFLFDLFRIFRWQKRRHTVRMAVEDTLFFLLSALLIFWVLLQKNDGLVRLYEWGAAAVGVIVYRLFLSPVIFRVLLFLKGMLGKAGRFLVRILFFPLVLFCRILRKPVFAVISPMRLWGKNLKRRVREYIRNRRKRRKIAKKIWKKV